MIALTGTGTAPAVTLSPTSLTFGDQLLGTTSPAQTVTLTNSGTETSDDYEHWNQRGFFANQHLRNDRRHRRKLHDQREV